jgi:glutathione S-transferase/3-isopropylmalate dehydratase
MTLRIHHAKGTRSLRVVWLCEELGAPYEIAPSEFRKPSEELAAINPLRTLPVLEDGPVKMVESIAIMLYVMGKHMPTPLAAGPNDPGRADWLQFLIMGEAGIGQALSTIVRARFLAPEAEKRNWSVLAAEDVALKHYDFVADRLRASDYLAADRFTMADISVGYTIGIAQMIGLGDRLPPSVIDYHKRLTERPAYQRAAAK